MSETMPTKSICSSREEEWEVRKGPWTPEEDTLLIHYVTCHGDGRWNLLAKFAGLKRTGKSCRLRWLNYLKPDIKRGNLTPQEQILILELHAKLGNRWSKIAQHLPGRTDNEIKNYWRTRVQKHARQLSIDSSSMRFIDTLRRFWMPRLAEKMGKSPSSSSSSLLSSTSSPQPNTLVGTVDHLKERCSSSIYSSDSNRTMQLPETSQHAKNPANHGNCNTACNNGNSLTNECYYVDNSSFDLEPFNQLDMLAMGSDKISPPDCHMLEFDWMTEGQGTLWNIDDLWQFRKYEGCATSVTQPSYY